MGNGLGELRQHFHDVNAIVNASFPQNDIKSKFPLVLDANIPIERDFVWRKVLSLPASTLHISGMGISEAHLCTVQRHSYKRAVPGKGLQ
jgi:hypothetical protein